MPTVEEAVANVEVSKEKKDTQTRARLARPRAGKIRCAQHIDLEKRPTFPCRICESDRQERLMPFHGCSPTILALVSQRSL
jgi:hypothetical protein